MFVIYATLGFNMFFCKSCDFDLSEGWVKVILDTELVFDDAACLGVCLMLRVLASGLNLNSRSLSHI